MRNQDRRVWWWWWPVSVAVAGAVVFLGLSGFLGQRDRQEAEAERDGARTVAATATDLAARAGTALVDLGVAGRTVVLQPELAQRGAPPGAASVAVVEPRPGSGSGVEVVAGDMPAEVAGSPEAEVAIGSARDVGLATLAAPLPDSGEVLYVLPIYELDGERRAGLPGASTAERRDAWSGAVVLQVDVAALLAPVAKAVRVSDGVVVVGHAGGELTGDVAGLVVPVGSRQWLVEVPADAGGVPATGVLAVALGLLAAGGVLSLTRSVEVGARRAGIRAEARARQAGTIQRVATVLQQSQELGDVVPAFAVLLQSELDLDGFGLATYGADGVEQDVFAFGRPVGAEGPAAVEVDELDAGATLVLPLRRADRDIAVLRVRAARPLGSVEVESIRSAAELLAAALISAQAFERQEGAMEALRQVDELKNVFLGVASHELRTPVTAIGGFARILADRWDQLPDDQRRNLAARIEANAAALGVLVQDLLDFSRLERGRFVVDSEPVDLAGRLAAVIDRLGPIWGGRPVEVVIDDRPIVAGDGDALERVAANLLSNAAKFSPEGAAIVAGVGIEDGSAVLWVDDAGPGVPEEDRAHIYAPFFRGKGDSVVRTRGAGIGLSVVKEIVEQMGGAISVGTSSAGGARFEVRLPVARPEEISTEEVVG